MSSVSRLMEEFSSKSYLEKVVKIVTSFKTGKITGDEADTLALHLHIDPKDLTTIYEYGYSGSKKLFTQPDITLEQITSDKATHLEKIVLLALELKRNNMPTRNIRDYANKAGVDPQDVKNIYAKLEKEIEKLKKVKQKTATINEGIAAKDMHYTYDALHGYILQLFLYASPAYAFALHYQKAEKKYEKKQNFLKYMNKLADGEAIEEKISDAEDGYLNLFLTTISSTRDELGSLVQSNLGQAFSCSEETAVGLHNTLKSFRGIIDKETIELIIASNQLRPYLEESDDYLGMGMGMLKGAKIGSMAAAAFGPLGVAVAVGGLLYKGQEDADRAEENLDNLSHYWDECFVSLYPEKLSEYYKKCYEFSSYIADQYIVNYKDVEVLARQNNTLASYNEYLQSQLRFFVNDEMQQQMREDMKAIENIIQ